MIKTPGGQPGLRPVGVLAQRFEVGGVPGFVVAAPFLLLLAHGLQAESERLPRLVRLEGILEAGITPGGDADIDVGGSKPIAAELRG